MPRPHVSRLPKVRRDQLPPGPRWPVLAQSVGLLRFRHQFLPYLHRKYGDAFTVRLIPGGRPLVLFTRPEHAKEIFAGDPEVFHAGKGNAILGPIMGEHSLLLQDGAEHKRARKLLMPAFNGARAARLRSRWSPSWPGPRSRPGGRVRVPLARPDERAHPRGDPARRLRRHRRDAGSPSSGRGSTPPSTSARRSCSAGATRGCRGSARGRRTSRTSASSTG